MGDLLDPCQFCGDGKKANRAFMEYHADPNDAQMRTEWFDDTPLTVYGLICMNCGMMIAAMDPRKNENLPDFEELPDGTSSGGDFRIDGDLR